MKIYRNWTGEHWRQPELREEFEKNQTVFVLKMICLFPEPVIQELTERYGEVFTGLSRLEQLILITALTEEFVNHRRMKELVKDHPHDISQSLHALVEKGFFTAGRFQYSNILLSDRASPDEG